MDLLCLIRAMLVLVYQKVNALNSYHQAKIQFFKERQANVLLEFLDLPGGVELLKKYLRYQARRN